MAEGHAVARWGDALRALVGETVRAIQTPPRWRPRASELLGARLTDVVTHGKHLVLEFSNDWVIHTHAMQYGSWQIGSRRERLRKDARFIRLRIDTPRRRAVFFHGPVMASVIPCFWMFTCPLTTLAPSGSASATGDAHTTPSAATNFIACRKFFFRTVRSF